MSDLEEMVEFTGTLQAETPKAWRIEILPIGRHATLRDVWFAKSQCERLTDVTWEVPLWLAEKERLA